jgi:hypothetical protein
MIARVASLCTAVVLGLFGSMILAGPAQAHHGHEAATDWQLRDVTCDPYPDCTWGPATESVVTDERTLELTKPHPQTGTSMETTNLGLELPDGGTISVIYDLDTGADFAAGAVRMFWYNQPNKNTLLDAPTAHVAADAGNDTLTLTIPAGSTVGTFGLTYDASNPSTGTVHLHDLEYTVDGQSEFILFVDHPRVTPEAPTPVHGTCQDRNGSVNIPEVEGVDYDKDFKGTVHHGRYAKFKVTAEPEEGYVFPEGAQTEWIVKVQRKLHGCGIPFPPTTTPPTSSPSPSPTDPSPDPTDTASPTPTPTETTSPPVAGTGGEKPGGGLPLTGMNLVTLGGGALVLTGTGGLLYFLARRRNTGLADDQTAELPIQ